MERKACSMSDSGSTTRVGILETFGLRPLGQGLRDAWLALAGNPNLPHVQIGLSSVRIFKPEISLPTWMGKRRRDRKTPIYNFFNRIPAPRNEGYSVRVTYARDFRGGNYSYDGHLGTDFAVPVGTPVAAAAPGRVMAVSRHMNHGGLHITLDHGSGLITTSDHLSRSLVQEGKVVQRGQVIGLSGASGLEFILFFPWVAPHLHYNIWLNGWPVDPFAREGTDEVPLWRGGNEPVPCQGGEPEEDVEATPWDEQLIEEAISACKDPEERNRLRSMEGLEKRVAELLMIRNFRSPIFASLPSVYTKDFKRQSHLDLPFSAEDFVGAAFPQK